MNKVFANDIGCFITVYLDDILVFSKNIDELLVFSKNLDEH